MSMPMYFQWSTEVTVLFEQWHVESPGWYTVTAVAIFLVGLFYEWLITFRQGYEQRMHSKRLEEELKIQCDDDLYDVQASQPLKKLLRLTPQHQCAPLSFSYPRLLDERTSLRNRTPSGAGYFLFARLRRNVVINEAGCH
ncbi:Ctr copper transporter family protein [Acanthamoeba castellanii str. Neff]|uniref:Copper transport protein n=1 Tax=Acanthamoeba castellanii (strain ATCC 30010 / Neff) TaxID=1257118 RepID=L8GGD7_ACACF|nr:Ctr copper transporter family protein [Acanthamoeba castellanii str. Neff]ELR11924.1 Ctr copper transporter family protein [Acanthamoeba castellanii str. Neff]